MTRDGSTFWVTDDKAHAVFVYNASGNKVGEWFLDPADTSPSGITLNPNGGTDLWVVDRATHRVYDYAGATGWTSGNHSATSSFALASADGDPEGIADPNPPTVAIISPADNGQATAGSTVLVTGQVTASTPGTPVVAANGTPVDAVDAANNFFNRQSVALGPNASTYTAIDASGQASSPVTLHETGTNPPAGPIDFASLSDVTASFSPQYGRTSYNSATTVLYADMAAQDVGTYTVHTPLLVAVKHISNPLVRVRDYDGVLPDGTYYYDFSKLVAGRTIEPGQTTNNGVLAFFDPQQVPFTYDLVFLAPVNRPPSFTSVPVVETAAHYWYEYNSDFGSPSVLPYQYTARATDPDGDPVTYTLLAGPGGMSVDRNTGLVTWEPSDGSLYGGSNDIGNHNVSIEVLDGHGGTAVQNYVLTVVSNAVNVPPHFVTTPVVDAFVNVPYNYPSHAVDINGDILTYSLVTGPSGMTMLPASGALVWTPNGSQLGLQSVEIKVDDGRGGSDTQTFHVMVRPEPGNHPPVIVSTPDKSLLLPPPTFQGHIGGSVFLTGHDPDFHDLYGPNPPGARNIISAGIHYVMDPAYNPFVAAGIHKFLFVDSQLSDPQSGGGPVGVEGIVAAGYVEGQDFDVADVRSLNAALGALGSRYSAIVVASDFGGQLTQAELDLLNAHTADITRFINLGGGLFAMSENNEPGFQPPMLPNGGEFGYLPFPVLSASVGGELENGNTVTPFGEALGLTNADIAGNIEHNSFQPIAGFNIVDTDASSKLITLAGRGLVTSNGLIPDPAHTYMYQIRAFDPDNDPLTYSLVATNAPGTVTVNPRTGLLTWPAQPGNYSFTVDVTDGRGGSSIPPQSWNLKVDNLAAGEARGTVYRDDYQTGQRYPNEPGLKGVTVFLDANGNGVFDAGEVATTTDVDGNYRFTDLAVPGTYHVVAVAPSGWGETEPAGSTSYTLTFAASQLLLGIDFGFHDPNTTVNQQPAFASSPPDGLMVVPGQTTIVYQPTAADPDGEPLSFDLPVHPAGMIVDPVSGEIVWEPTADEKGVYWVLLRAQDGHGGATLQAFKVIAAGYESAPTITSTPPSVPPVKLLPWVYQVRAEDAENDPLNYSLDIDAPGLSINSQTGLLTFTPQQTGEIDFTVIVDDGRGGDAYQPVTLNVSGSAPDGSLALDLPVRTTIPLGRTYYGAARGSDTDGDPLHYSMTTSLGWLSIDPNTGAISGTATGSPGTTPVTVTVSDGRATPVSKTFNLTVTTTGTNSPPQITSSPPLVDIIGNSYAYNAQATDPDSDVLLWSLETAPAGLSINPGLGTIRWDPTPDQVGTFPVTVRVSDPYGGSTTQAYAITVRGVDTPPQILSTAQTAGAVGQAYTYAVRAQDIDGDPIHYKLIGSHPVGLDFPDPSSNLLPWASPVAGSYPLTIEVSDGLGGTDTQSFTLVVAAAAPNRPPVLNWTPKQATLAGQPFTDAVLATDPDGDPLHYQILGDNLGWLTIGDTSGVLSGTPPAGTYHITVQVTDDTTGLAEETYTLVASADSGPTIAPATVPTATAGVPYEFDIHASDPDGDPLTYQLDVTGLPSGEAAPTIDNLGRITWLPLQADVGVPLTLHVTVKDTAGVTASHTYALTAVGDLEAPKASIELSRTTGPLGSQVTVVVLATDNVGVVARTLTHGTTTYPLDAHGAATITLDALGPFTVSATATDTAGNTTSPPATATITVFDPNVTTAPTASFTAQSSTVAASNATDATTHLPTFAEVHVGPGQCSPRRSRSTTRRRSPTSP
ncbi:Putative Ig domain-containing protein [Singulisphaera sp. GP187]|nr:Putative Ig domain-containing protein [Singulisphaera sp. GP187]